MFASCVVPVHSWSTFTFLDQMPGWLVYLNAWDLIGTFAYTQAFALLESIAVLLVVILLGAILPARFLRDRFATRASILVLLTLGCGIVAQSTGRIPFTGSMAWPSKSFILGGTLYLASIGASYGLMHRYRHLEEAVHAFMERLTVFLYIYVPVGILSVAIVVVRNI